jgi:soluble lytic murein transglycosylase
MAQQLLDGPTPAAYAGVETYALRHAQADSGALAWLAVGYSRYRAGEYDKAVSSLKQAGAHAGEIGDYVDHFLGASYVALGDAPSASALLRDFDSRYPDSLFSREAALNYARALIKMGESAQAAQVLSSRREPIRADIELTLARALLDSGNTPRAILLLRNLYYNLPLSDEASTAGDLLQSTPGAPEGTAVERRTRADLLARGRRYREAIATYRDLLTLAAPDQQPDLRLALARTLHRNGEDREARGLLENLSFSVVGSSSAVESQAERLYYLAEIARSDRDEDRFQMLVQQLRETAPASRWLEQALLSAANMYLLKPDYDHAIDFYREIGERFSSGSLAPSAHWKAAWLAFRQGRVEEARRDFEQQIARYPSSPQASAAIYWRARIAEDDKDIPRAWACYQRLSQRFANYYYSDLARERMMQLKRPAVIPEFPLLDHLPPIILSSAHAALPALPSDDIRLGKARLLQNAALYDFAARELQSAADQGADWAAIEMARMYTQGGLYFQALRTLKRTVPSYFSVELDALPRPYWESLFPRAYWTDLEKFALDNGLNPFLVASLIRQESEFNPGAVSRTNALGLMQLMPATAKNVARQLGIRGFSNSQLLVPSSNLRLGMRHFRELLDRFDGKPEYALAAYNAGASRVDSWLMMGNYRDAVEFVESIPFTETREYVQAIMRNASVYRRLYQAQERLRVQPAAIAPIAE